jgi:hypothetical protein
MADFQPAFKVTNTEAIKLCDKIFDSKDGSDKEKNAKRDLGKMLQKEQPSVRGYHFHKTPHAYYITVDSYHKAPAGKTTGNPDNPFGG